jgi:hypothetical protein
MFSIKPSACLRTTPGLRAQGLLPGCPPPRVHPRLRSRLRRSLWAPALCLSGGVGAAEVGYLSSALQAAFQAAQVPGGALSLLPGCVSGCAGACGWPSACS